MSRAQILRLTLLASLRGEGKSTVDERDRVVSYWLVVREDRDRMEVLTVWLTGRGEALPVFGSEEEARSFCEREASARESGWRLRQTST
jgi:hypothetical protein